MDADLQHPPEKVLGASLTIRFLNCCKSWPRMILLSELDMEVETCKLTRTGRFTDKSFHRVLDLWLYLLLLYPIQ
jgi:hypothetical protein